MIRTLTITFALALLVVAGCAPKAAPGQAATQARPQAQPQAAAQTQTQPAPQATPQASPQAQPKSGAVQPQASTNLPKLWDFWATWCPPCRELKPIIEALEKEYDGKIEIKSIDVDQNKDLAQKFNVQAIPTLVFLDAKSTELSRIVGLTSKDTIVARFKTHGFIQ